MKRTANRRGSRRGFTLMEMLIVLGILVALLSLVLPRVLGTRKKAKISEAKAQIGFLHGCLEQYCLHMDEYPATEQGLLALVEEPAAADGTTTATRWQGPYTKTGELPTDPWGNEYQYQYPPQHSKGDQPDIWSFGPDGEDNTEDDIVSWKVEAGESGDGLGEMEGDLEPDLTPEPLPPKGSRTPSRPISSSRSTGRNSRSPVRNSRSTE